MATKAGDGSDSRGHPTQTGPGPLLARAPPPLPKPASVRQPAPPAGPPSAEPLSGRRKTAASARPPKRGVFWAVCVRPLRVCLRCAVVVVPLFALLFGGLYLRLLNSPLSVPFLAEPISRALNAELPGLTVAVEDAVLHLSPRGGLEFRLKTVRVTDPQGAAVASAAFAGIELSWRALRSGRVAPARIDLIEPQMLLARDDKGKVSVSISAAAPASSSPPPSTPSTPSGAAAPAVAVGPAEPPQPLAVNLDFAHTIAQMVARARQGGEVASHLEAIGLRDASVVIDSGGQKQVWKVPELRLGLVHKQKRSHVTLDARVQSGAEPWTVSLRADEAEKSKSIPLVIKFDKLDPRDLARSLPSFGVLSTLNALLSGEARMELTPEGDVLDARLDIAMGAGSITLPVVQGVPLAFDEGSLALRFDAAARRLELIKASLVSGRSQTGLAGTLSPPVPSSPDAGWSFDVHAKEGSSLAVDAQSPPIAIEQLIARGGFGGTSGLIELRELTLKAGGIDVAMSGRFGDEVGLEGRIGPAPLATLAVLWPQSVAPRHRARFTRGVTKGQLKGGTFKVTGAPGGERNLSLSLEATDIEIAPREGLPPLEAPRALLRLEGTSLEINFPEATITASANRKLSLKGHRITVIGLDQERPVAEIATRLQGPLPALLELCERGQFGAPHLPQTGIDGKVDAQFKVTLPLDGQATFAETRVEGRARITDGRIKDIIGTHDISGAAMTIDAGEKGFDVKGEMLLAGILAKFGGQWFPNAPEGRQPPLRITARLDNADRAQLGLDLEELVQGEVPFEVTVQRGTGDDVRIHVVGDLTAAELMLDEVEWRKPIGRPARLEFDVGKGRQAKGIELQNFKVSGENIAIDGWVSIGPDNKAKEYHFPDFSLNVVSNLEVRGVLRPERVWDIKATGKTFNGADLFRSLFTFDGAPTKPPRKNKPGLEINVEVDTLLGPDDTSLRQVKLHAAKRGGQFNSVDLKGTLESGAPLIATLRTQPGQPRILVANAGDTGQALKLIGFYPNMIGGKGELRVNIEGRGAAEKTGTLVVRNFRILGDPIVAEVLTGDASKPKPSSRQRVVREQIQFDVFKGEFAVGNSQLAITEAAAHGPIVGGSIYGKVDFRAKRMDLEGTYVPLSGLNRLLSPIPLIGEIFTGPKGDGVFGIKYRIHGNTEDPQVEVNPFSLLTPGFMRGIFQIVPDNPQVTPRSEAPKETVAPQIGASPPADVRRRDPAPRAGSEVGDGWSQQVTKDAKGNKK